MKTVLGISLLTNIALALAVVRLSAHHSPVRDRWGSAPTAPAMASANISTRPDGQPSETLPQPDLRFRWEQLESADYRAFVANLRKVGCPEQTVRDIIVADVHNLYAPKCLELQAKLSAQGESQRARQPDFGQALEADSQKLHDEEADVVATLLGSQSSGKYSSAENLQKATALPRPLGRDPADQPVPLPLVFQRMDPGLRLDRSQTEVLENLRRRFLEEIGGRNQDPNDPVYFERWQAAQRKSDDLLQSFLGGEFFVNYQLLAADDPALAQ